MFECGRGQLIMRGENKAILSLGIIKSFRSFSYVLCTHGCPHMKRGPKPNDVADSGAVRVEWSGDGS